MLDSHPNSIPSFPFFALTARDTPPNQEACALFRSVIHPSFPASLCLVFFTLHTFIYLLRYSLISQSCFHLGLIINGYLLVISVLVLCIQLPFPSVLSLLLGSGSGLSTGFLGNLHYLNNNNHRTCARSFLSSVQYMNLIPNVQLLCFLTTKTAELTPP
ncbi:hypothetical protein NW761_011200 [Fusarium oxysporum]|nr:hypothetical protein NW758_012314 [Fusarium oxysporum]KAJ4060700.1 hypothetical protein NW753_004966 [Fusarium oxysporum]KAJ4064007.1 hypothetical protein NW763_004284 [Fusarium oxysporum]KAJ4077085.1 hypothetical protein NW756_012574 [Fusarium oxysporum]KAJ4079792.1 hypothetical protein NW761_011200 [Fusarium oxysporum]